MADKFFEPEISASLRYFEEYGDINVRYAPLALECKKLTRSPRLSFSKVKDYQIEGLLDFKQGIFAKKLRVASAHAGMQNRFRGNTEFDYLFTCKGTAYLLVNFRFTRKKPRNDIDKGINRAIAITPEQYQNRKKDLLKEGTKSIDYWWFVENGIELDRIRLEPESLKNHQYGWDIRPLLEVL